MPSILTAPPVPYNHGGKLRNDAILVRRATRPHPRPPPDLGPASADSVHIPDPIADCPTGSVSSSPGMGLFHGSFAYCAPHACRVDAACPGELRCRDVALQIEHRFYSRGGGHGAIPGPRLHASRVVGPCDTPEGEVIVTSLDLTGVGDGPDVEPGCRRIRVCAPANVGDPPATATEEPAAGEPPPTEPVAPEPVATETETEPEEQVAAAPAVDPPEPPSSGCACRSGVGGGHGHVTLAFLLLVALRRRILGGPRRRRSTRGS